jgi:hypothetical protein
MPSQTPDEVAAHILRRRADLPDVVPQEVAYIHVKDPRESIKTVYGDGVFPPSTSE